MDRSLARARYAQQKSRAKIRGIEWEFTFEEWWAIWEPHWAHRGQRKDGMVMCRTHDQGPYRPDNVRIDTPKSNAAEAGLMRKCRSTYLHLPSVRRDVSREGGFKSYGNFALRPDKALEAAQEEYEWIPGE